MTGDYDHRKMPPDAAGRVDRDAPTEPESAIPAPFPSPPKLPRESAHDRRTGPPRALPGDPHYDLEILMDRVVERALKAQSERLAEAVDGLRESVDAATAQSRHQTDLLVHEMQRHSARLTDLETASSDSRSRIVALERSIADLKRAQNRDTDPIPSPLDAE